MGLCVDYDPPAVIADSLPYNWVYEFPVGCLVTCVKWIDNYPLFWENTFAHGT